MARSFAAASTQFLNNNAWTVGAPLTMACWFNANTATTRYGAMSLHTGLANEWLTIQVAGDLGGDPLRFAQKNGTPQENAVTSTGFSASTWQHGCGVLASSTDRRVFLNGGGKGTNTNSLTINSYNNIDIGNGIIASSSWSRTAYFDGAIAEAVIYNVALTDGEVAELATGVSPMLVRPDGIVALWSLRDNDGDVDWWGQNNLTANASPTYSQHPPIIYPNGLLTVNKAAAGGGGGGTTGNLLLRGKGLNRMRLIA